MRLHSAELSPGVLKTVLVGGVLTQATSEPMKRVARTPLINGAETVVETSKPVVNGGDKGTEDRQRQLTTLIGLSEKFGDSLSKAFAKNVSEGKKFDNVLKSVRQSLVETGLRLALAPLQLALSQSVKGMMTGAFQGSYQAALMLMHWPSRAGRWT